ncbi:MAG: hypothetical protein ACOCQM_05925 [Natronomonas sp.]
MTDDLGDFDPDAGVDTDDSNDYAARVEAALEGVRTDPVPGSLAIDLVTRQLLFVRNVVADDLATYYEQENFDLLTYGPHPWLPGVTTENSVLECYYVNDLSIEGVDDLGKRKGYDFPAGRLCVVPIEQAWNDEDVGDV